MGADFSVFNGKIGLLKIYTVVVGALTVLFTATSFKHMEKEPKEVAYLIVISLAFTLTMFWLLFYGVLDRESMVRRVDMILHIVFGLFVLPASIVWFVSVYEYEVGDGDKHHSSTGNLIDRILAGIFGFSLGIVYLVLGYWIRKKNLRFH